MNATRIKMISDEYEFVEEFVKVGGWGNTVEEFEEKVCPFHVTQGSFFITDEEVEIDDDLGFCEITVLAVVHNHAYFEPATGRCDAEGNYYLTDYEYERVVS